MYYRVVEQPDHSVRQPTGATSEMLRHIETQIEALLSQHSSLMVHMRAIERQLASIAAQIQGPGVELTPRAAFLLVEMRGSGGVSEQLEQIAHIVHEQGYWKPKGRVQHYCRQDVYALGKSTQKLFDDYVVLDRRVEQLNVRLGHIKHRWCLEAEKTIQDILQCIATALDTIAAYDEMKALVALLEPVTRPGWTSWLFRHR